MCLVGNLLHICFSFITDDGNSHIFRKTFDISGKTWVDEAKVILMYSGKEYDFSDASLNEIYRDKGFAPRAEGLIEMVSAWSQYQNEYYATGLAIEHPNNGFVVKTRDFRIMELVDIIPFNDMGMAEIASYIFMDRLFVACRQDYGIPYIYLGSLNLKKWSGSIITRFPTATQGPGFLKRTASYSFLIRRKKEIADI